MVHCWYSSIDSGEVAYDEAELGPDEFAEIMHNQQNLLEQIVSSYILAWVWLKVVAKWCKMILFLISANGDAKIHA